MRVCVLSLSRAQQCIFPVFVPKFVPTGHKLAPPYRLPTCGISPPMRLADAHFWQLTCSVMTQWDDVFQEHPSDLQLTMYFQKSDRTQEHLLKKMQMVNQ